MKTAGNISFKKIQKIYINIIFKFKNIISR